MILHYRKHTDSVVYFDSIVLRGQRIDSNAGENTAGEQRFRVSEKAGFL